MSDNRGGGRFSRESFDRPKYEQALTDFRHVLDTAEVVGQPSRGAELYELERLVKKYPVEARHFLDKTMPPADPPP